MQKEKLIIKQIKGKKAGKTQYTNIKKLVKPIVSYGFQLIVK